MSVQRGPEPISVSSADLGQQTVTARLMPEGTSPGQMVRSYLVPAGAEELACLLCRTARQESGMGETAARLLRMVNDERAGGCAACGTLLWDARLRRSALYQLSEAHDDPRQNIQKAGASFLSGWILEGFMDKPIGLAVTEEDLLLQMTAWMADGAARGHILHPGYTRAGIAFKWSGTLPRGWYVAVAMADQAVQEEAGVFQGTTPELPCAFACVQQLEYYRRKVAETWEGEEILSDFITFRWRTPDLCNLWKVELTGDVRGKRVEYVCQGFGADRCVGEISESKSDGPILGNRDFEYEMASVPPFPGEFFKVWGYLDGISGDCNPILIACCWFSHFCYTSGKIVSIVLYEGGEIIDERASGSTPVEWIGDERLAYKTSCEGETLIVVPSDFQSYGVEERVVIQKGGTHTLKTLGGEIKEAGCQDPEGATEFDFLRWDLMRPFPDHADGVILPQKFWGI